MVRNHFNEDTENALQAKEFAQWIAFAPVVFQASRTLRNSGILACIESAGKNGITLQEIHSQTQISKYGVRVLCEAGLAIGLIYQSNNVLFLTKRGFFILHDKLTTVNLDFIHDVCYKGLFELDESIASGKPKGLKHLGNWNTVYEGLSKLNPEIQKSWFAFDHYYSDDAFPLVLPHVFKYKPKTLLDIGGNTGKWTLQCLQYDTEVSITIADLPGQSAMAEKNIADKGYLHRVNFYPVNVLDEKNTFPAGMDAIWMSQFLDCFSEDEIVSILKRCREVLNPDGRIFIMEPFWDTQRFKIGSFCLMMTSLYFTTIANGNSQMYNSEFFKGLVEKSGLKVSEQIDDIGVSQTLLVCQK